MAAREPVFVDANALVYVLDSSSPYFLPTVAKFKQHLDAGGVLCTSHHVIEEVLHIVRKLGAASSTAVMAEIAKIPNLVLVEPAANIGFAERYARLSDGMQLGINDALLLQLMLDAGITKLFTYDLLFAHKAAKLHIQTLTLTPSG